MKSVDMKYGKEAIKVIVNDESFLGLLESNSNKESKTELEIILQALASPIESKKLQELVKAGEKVCIIISDITRAWQKIDLYLPYIVKELNSVGIRDEDIVLLCATGSHRAQTEEEHEALVGENLASRFKVVDHDCKDTDNLIHLGTTSYGTPVVINKRAMQCDHIILTGAIVFHDLAGWGGGKKSILPGIAAYESIMANHKLSLKAGLGEGLNPLVRCGNALDNPIHLDMLEAAAMVKPTFLFNVIVDDIGNITNAVAGDYIKAHEAGRSLVKEQDSIIIKERSDLVIASAGGYPKDIDLYQSSKALINAKEAVKKGGAIILLAACAEGYGGDHVRQMLEDFNDSHSREAFLRKEFSVAKYTGYLIAQIAREYKVILVSNIKQESLLKANILAASNIEEAMEIAAMQQGEDRTVYLIPSASNVLPRLT